MYRINRKSGAINLYKMTRIIWWLIDKNKMFLKAVHIPEKLNSTSDKLSFLEMSGDYHLPQEVFQII
jgi:hypothetical protein